MIQINLVNNSRVFVKKIKQSSAFSAFQVEDSNGHVYHIGRHEIASIEDAPEIAYKSPLNDVIANTVQSYATTGTLPPDAELYATLARHATNLAQFFMDCMLDGSEVATQTHNTEDAAVLIQYCMGVFSKDDDIPLTNVPVPSYDHTILCQRAYHLGTLHS